MRLVLAVLLGVLISIYSQKVLGYKQNTDNSIKKVGVHIISGLLGSGFGVFSDKVLDNTIISYVVLYVFVILCLEVLFDGKLLDHAFLSSQFVFFLLLSKALTVASVSTLVSVNMNDISRLQHIDYEIMLVSMIVTGIIFGIFIWRFSVKKTKIILENVSKVKFLMVIQVILNILISINTVSYRFKTIYIWLAIYHMVIYIMIGVIFYVIFEYCVKESMLNEYKIGYSIYQDQLHKQIESYNTQTEYIKSMRKFKHDYVIIKKMLQKMLYSSDITEIGNMVREMDETIEDISLIHKDFSNNPLVQAILAHTYTMSRKNGVKFDGKIIIPEDLEITELEICRIITNLMDNAMDATKKLESNGYIKVNSYLKNHWHITVCENNFDGELEIENRKVKTSKADKISHGYGIENIKEIVERKKGFVKIEHGEILGSIEKTFTIKIYLPNVVKN